MKNKKSMLSLGLIALVLFLGVGYAVVNTNDLLISGSASVADSKIDVEFLEASPEELGTGKVVAGITDKLSATITVTGLETEGESATATYTIKNNDDTLKAFVTEENIIVSEDAYFSVATDLGAGKTIEPGQTIDVVVTVTLDDIPFDVSETEITINLKATPQQ